MNRCPKDCRLTGSCYAGRMEFAAQRGKHIWEYAPNTPRWDIMTILEMILGVKDGR